MAPCSNLTELREKYRLSMGMIAKKIGVTPATVWQWEHKDPTELKPKAIKALKTVFPPAEVTLMINPDADVSEESFEMPGQEPVQEQFITTGTFQIEPELEPEPEPEDETLSDLREVYDLLSDSGREQLLSYARYLFMVDKGVNFAVKTTKG